MQGKLSMAGSLSTRVIRASGPGLLWKLQNLPNLLRGWRVVVMRLFRLPGLIGRLRVRLIREDGSVVNYGLVSLRVVTDAFVELMVDELQTETSVWGDFKYHDSGVGVTGAAVGDTDIETTDGEDRVAGTQIEGATAEIYKSVGTIAYTTTKAITEHGLFNTSDTATLLDRHVFSAINVVDGDSIEFSYELSCTAGG